MKVLIYKKNNLIGKSGGAEKVMCNMANYFASQGYDVTLATRDVNSGELPVALDKRVNFLQLKIYFSRIRRGIGKILASVGLVHAFPFFDRELYISDFLKNVTDSIKPDVIILTGLAELVDFTYKQDIKAPIILAFHSVPSVYFNTNEHKLKLYSNGLNKVSACQVLLPSFKQILEPYYKGKIEVIGNAVGTQHFEKNYENSNNTIIYLARVEDNKQHDVLIDSFAQISSNYPQWRVEFWGDIHSKKYYKKCIDLIKEYSLEESIVFKGVTKHPFEELKKTDICAFPSKYEGFGLALAEAMSFGLPCVAFKSCSGVNELIRNEHSGLLAENYDDFTQKLGNLMNDWKLREKIGKYAQKSIEGYSPEIIWTKCDNLIKDIIERT